MKNGPDNANNVPVAPDDRFAGQLGYHNGGRREPGGIPGDPGLDLTPRNGASGPVGSVLDAPVPAMSLTISAIAVLIFSLYILYDVSNIVRGGETNYITATLNLFLDVYNIFISLLNLLLAFSGQRD